MPALLELLVESGASKVQFDWELSDAPELGRDIAQIQGCHSQPDCTICMYTPIICS